MYSKACYCSSVAIFLQSNRTSIFLLSTLQTNSNSANNTIDFIIQLPLQLNIATRLSCDQCRSYCALLEKFPNSPYIAFLLFPSLSLSPLDGWNWTCYNNTLKVCERGQILISYLRYQLNYPHPISENLVHAPVSPLLIQFPYAHLKSSTWVPSTYHPHGRY